LVYDRDPRAPLRWHSLLTTGYPLMLDRLAIPCTTLENELTFTVPDGERWVVLNGNFYNCTLSSGDLVLVIEVLDRNGDWLGYLRHEAACTTLETVVFPDNVSSGFQFRSCYPMPIYEGQMIHVSVGADAAKSGSAYLYLNVLRFMVHDQI